MALLDRLILLTASAIVVMGGCDRSSGSMGTGGSGGGSGGSMAGGSGGSVTGGSGGSADAGTPTPAQAFATAYCALVDPCCTSEGRISNCGPELTTVGAFLAFDPTAAAACLAALRALPAGAAFCGDLAKVHPSWNDDAAVLPACVGVFTTQNTGSGLNGSVCESDADCAPGPTGRSACVSDPTPGVDARKICVEVSGTLADLCVGTYSSIYGYYVAANPHGGGLFCDRTQGLVCDDTTHVCVAQRGLGDPCAVITDCDGVTTRCDFSAQVCAAPIAVGQACTTVDPFQCAATTYCNANMGVCTPQEGAGAACSDYNYYRSDCLGGTCGVGATCVSQLYPLCH